MGFSYDTYNNLKPSRMFLANPQKDYIGTISGAEAVKLTLKFNNLNELSFNVYEYIDGEYTEFYDKLECKRLIELQFIGWFQISNIEKQYDDITKETYKTIKCLSLENELVTRTIYDINGVFQLYDSLDPSKSLLHIISTECGWSIGTIDQSLLGKYRTFSIDSAKIYNILTQDISKSFECIFSFNTFTRTINVHKLSNMGLETDIVISRKNIMNSFVEESNSDDIITKLRIIGGDDGNGGNVDIRSVNPTSTNYIINLDFFMTTDWVSQSLIDAWNTYKIKYNNVITSYTTNLSLLKTKQSELTVLKATLVDLNSLKTSQDNVKGNSITLHGRAPYSNESDYTVYQNAITLINTYTSQIITKGTEITNKNNEITEVTTILNSIGSSLNISTNFTSAQLAEMNMFITEGDDYNDSTFVITDTMSDDEITDMKLELMQYATNELARVSQPQITVNITASSLFTIQDDKDELISYKEWRDQFEIGNLISIKFRDDYFATVRLMEMTIDFDKPEEIDLKFSDKSRLDDALIQFQEVVANAGRTASSMSLSKYGYDAASSIVNDVRVFINGVLNCTLNNVVSNDNQELLIDNYGLHGRKFLVDQNKYDDHQMWLNNQNLLFTSDGWKTTSLAMGLLTLPDGSMKYGIATDVIFGNFMLTSALTISNENNTITMNKDGAIFKDCDITITKGSNILKLNAIDGIKLTNNGTSKFYFDGDGNITYGGVLSGVSGNIGGWEITSDGLTSKNTLASINLYNQNNKAMQITYSGLHLYNHYTGNNEYLGSIAGTYSEINGSNGILLAHGLNAEYIGIGYVDGASPSSGSDVYMDMIYTRNGYNDGMANYIQGFHFKLPVYLTSNLTVAGNINCNTINGSIPASQYWVQSSFPSMSAFNYLAARVSALEGA